MSLNAIILNERLSLAVYHYCAMAVRNIVPIGMTSNDTYQRPDCIQAHA
jgi:hypothetical protein